ncbi:MAG: hypothetical protein ACTHU0_32380 [Kofleriaceae bacterium]
MKYRRPRDLTIDVPGERSTTNKIVLGALAGSAVVLGALGVYYNLDARDAADAISRDHFIGTTWGAAEVGLADRADRSSTRAKVYYGVGGAVLVGTVVAFLITAPKTDQVVIHTTGALPTVNPVAGGAVVGSAWRF